MQIDKLNLKKLIQLSAFIIFLFWGLNNYSTIFTIFKFFLGVMAPFILGCCMAFVLNIPLNFIENVIFKQTSPKFSKYKRSVSITFSILFITGIVLLIVLLVFPELGKTLVLLASTFSFYITKIGEFATTFMVQNPDIETFLTSNQLDWDSIISSTGTMLQSVSTSLINSAVSLTVTVVSGLLNILLGLIFSIYILSQKSELTKLCKSAMYAYLDEKKADRAIYIFSLSNKTFSSFVTGQCTEAIILGAMFFVFMLIFKMPYALTISVLVGFTALVPIFGAFIGCAVGILLILMVNPMQAVWFLIMFLVIQQIEGNIIYPRVVGSSIGLPPIWVLLAFTIGGGTMGVIGMLIFIPLASVIYTLITDHINNRIIKRSISSKKLEGK